MDSVLFLYDDSSCKRRNSSSYKLGNELLLFVYDNDAVNDIGMNSMVFTEKMNRRRNHEDHITNALQKFKTQLGDTR